MAQELVAMGVPADRIVQERRSANTRDHPIYVSPLLRDHHVRRFVLVTSRQHIARALRVFRKAGWDPIPSSPEVLAIDSSRVRDALPSKEALEASEHLIYDELALLYYWLRGWL